MERKTKRNYTSHSYNIGTKLVGCQLSNGTAGNVLRLNRKSEIQYGVLQYGNILISQFVDKIGTKF